MSDFAKEFQKATGLPVDMADYYRLRVAARLGGWSHAELNELVGVTFDVAPADWRNRLERANAAAVGETPDA